MDKWFNILLFNPEIQALLFQFFINLNVESENNTID
jgi:hypothetical protein